MLGLHSLFTTKESHISNPVLDAYLSTPLVDIQTLLSDCTFMVLDFETTGLDHTKDNLVSMGWIEIEQLTINLGSSKHIMINPKGKLTSESVLIHKLTDDELQQGVSISVAMEMLLTYMKNKILIVHFRMIEEQFINEICWRLYELKQLPMRIIDTLEIELNKHPALADPGPSEGYRLHNLREKYHLPRYKAHNATIDALATAELFLAQLNWMGGESQMKLKELL